MMRTFFSTFIFFFTMLSLLAAGTGIPSDMTVNRKQGELRAALRNAEKNYSKFPSSASIVPEVWLKRQEEMARLLSRMSFPAVTEQATQSGASRMWEQRKRTACMPAVTAKDYFVGPNGSVIPFSGEFTDSADDLAGLERGGIGFKLQRRYLSFSKYDCGFGTGWNFNYNAGIVIDGEDCRKASRLTMFIGAREIRFTRNAQGWKPERGMFFRLEFNKDRIFAYTPDLRRYEFELAKEQILGAQRWRLAKIAARHNQYRANYLTISYLPNCDRIQELVDPFGEKFHFIYDRAGHISRIASQKQYAEYDYDAAGNLVKVRYAPIKLSLDSDFQPGIEYLYNNEKVPLLVGKKSTSQKFKLFVDYDPQTSRALRAGFAADNQKQIWFFKYCPQNVTVVQAPQPSPEVRYSFIGTSHPSLPGTFEIPAQQAKWHYTFNQDFLLTSVTGPLGIRKTRSYDSNNPNVLAHCNIVKVEQFPAPAGKDCGLKSRGTRTKYHEKIALPTEIVYFQVDKDNKERVLKKESFTYSDDDFLLICHDDGGIKQYKAYNHFGLPALEWDANKNVTIFYYGENFPKNYSFDFNNGDVKNGGPLVRIVQDAKTQDIKAACKAIGHKEISRNEIKRITVAPRALEALYAYDPYGNRIRSKSGYNETFSVFSSNGKVLVSCDASSGITEYQYCKSGRTDRIYHEFCPGENASYQGNLSLHFSGSYYYAELFQYDSLDMLKKHQLTDECFRNVAPVFRYERYPNGKVKRIVNPMGIARVDEYDLKTGYLQKQTLVGGNSKQCLTSEYQYYPDGQVKSYVDMFDGRHFIERDGFGRVISTTDAKGVKKQQEFDALDRETAKSVSNSEGKLLGRTEFQYSSKNQKLESERVYLIDGDKKEVVESARYLYDDAGNLIGKKGIREDSWQYFLIDGLGNSIAEFTPEGDISVKVLRNGKPVYASMRMHGKNNTKTTGVFSEYDFAGRLIKNTPVDDNGELVKERSQTFIYNNIGQKIRTDSEQLTTTTFTYNSLGKILTEEIRPASTEFGEKPQNTEYEYRADGQVSCKRFKNQALALRGEKSDAKPELVDAPQESKWFYDELGRIEKTIQPDGLITSKIYNKSSLPSDIKWAHISEPDKLLRHLELKYTNCGEVSSILDGISGKILREYTYDKLGRCVVAVDHSNIQPVRLERDFDSLGNMSSEKIEYNGLPLPYSSFKYNLPKGEFSAEWMNFIKPSDRTWGLEIRHYDRASRLTGISLDGKPFANWNYLGNLCEKREIEESRISSQTTYNALLEPVKTELRDVYSSTQIIGCFSYDYGLQGQPIFSAVKLGEDYSFSSFSQFDSFRRVVGQNGEAVNPADVSEARKRHSEIFGEKSKAIASINTSWMAYDQANNIWGRYFGQKMNSADPDMLCNPERMPNFYSSAPVIAGATNTDISDGDLRKLASNRAVSTAMYSSDCNLNATEQKYDDLGNLVEYEGTFWNGTRRYPVRWKLTFDPLGRLNKMDAVALKSMGFVEEGTPVAELVFAYDAENRRIMKEVTDRTRDGAVKHTEITLYRGNQQCLVYELKDKTLKFKGEYLWGASERELLMAALPERWAENQGDFLKISRYFFQQDKGLNVVFTSKVENGEVRTVAAESYLGFGDNSTFAKIRDIESSMSGANKERAFNRRLDEPLDASWYNPGNRQQSMLLQLSEESKLAQLTIWASKFSKNFFVFILPKGERTPSSENLGVWLNEQKNWENYFAARVCNGKFGDQIMGGSLTSPYRLPLRELKGDRILLVFCDNEDIDFSVREFEVCKVADNPSPIAFAGQWLDRETGMYYQINRYRLVGSDKFISPDPIGFLDGNNLYAYAKGNPLEWHDPDGRWVQILAGAGIGAVLGGGMYALNCWLTGAEFSWAEFGVSVFAGAVSGAIAAALLPVNPILAGFAAGAVGGAITEGGITYIRTGDWEESLIAAGKGAVWGGMAGAFAGGLGIFGGNTSKFLPGLLRSSGISALTGGVFGGARRGFDAYSETGDWGTAFYAAGQGFVHGAIMGGVAGAGGYSLARLSQASFRNGNSSSIYERPAGYRKGVRDQVWENAREVSTGQVRDPLTGRFMSKDSPWDMGHKPGYEWWKFQRHAEARGLSREQVITWNNNPKHFRPELPSSNRCHAAENLTSEFFGADDIPSGGLADGMFGIQFGF